MSFLPGMMGACRAAQIAGGGPPAADVILLETGDALLLETTDPLDKDAGIPAQSAASTLDGTEWTVIVQGGTTKKVATATLAGFLNG